MNIYNRDYCCLTVNEKAVFEAIKHCEKSDCTDDSRFSFTRYLWHEYPKAVRHFHALFPNNFIDPIDFDDIENLKNIANGFRHLVDCTKCTERQVLDFINQSRCHIIMGALFDMYNFGHHDAFVFPEFQLGNSYKVDYLLVGKNSDGWHFVLIELESVYGRVSRSDESAGEVIRKGYEQVADWKHWIEAKFVTFAETFEKSIKKGDALPDEFRQYDSTRFHFVVIAGRRNAFTNRLYKYGRKTFMNEAIKLLHYDNLIEAVEKIVKRNEKTPDVPF